MKKLLLACMLLANHAQAQMAVLVKDITPGSAGSTPWGLYPYNNLVLFSAAGGLWVSDGTDAGTSLIKSFGNGGVNQFDPPVTLNGNVIYSGCGTSGFEPWKTNGTVSGTNIILDVNGAAASYPSYFTVFNGKVYFTADDGLHGEEVWVTDGTAAGTKNLLDIYAGAGNASPFEYTVLNSKMYFIAADAANGQELWATDGTPGGTALFKDITPGSNHSSINDLTVFNNKLYFYNRFGNELWVCNGTPAGTIMLKDLMPGSSTPVAGAIQECNGKLFFIVTDGNGRELWVTDGTVPGTQMVKDINAAGDGVGYELYAYKNKIYFAGNTGNGRELWASDGTAAGTAMVKSIYPVTGGSPTQFTMYNDKLYFTAKNAASGWQLWVTDGTDAGTVMVPVAGAFKNDALSNTSLCVAGGKLFFGAAYDATKGLELYSLTTYPADVQSVPALTGIKVYPNPAKDNVTIQYTLTKAGSPQYGLYDMTGRCVATWYDAGTLTGTQTKQLDISNLAPAMYQLQIAVNGKVQSVSVVKQ